MEIKFDISDALYCRDPQETDLGRRIVEHGILIIDKIGFEAFTFKKLASEIGSTEKSIYRYFENKHCFLLFVTSWYWEWVHYLITMNIRNISSPKKKIKIAIENLVLATAENPANQYINEAVLHKVIVKESGKAYHINSVDDENKAGMFFSYKKLVELLAAIIEETNPKFPYASSLASNLFEMSNNQIYFAEHLPRLSSIKCGNCQNEDLIEMLAYFASKLLGQKI